MTQPAPAPAPTGSRTLLALLLLGVTSGLPNEITQGTLQAWLTDLGYQPGAIGLFQLVGLAYVFKFLWAPLVDRWSPPFLGRRRGWLLLLQGGLAMATLLLALTVVSEDLPWMAPLRERVGEARWLPLAITAVGLSLAWLGATFDVALNGYACDALDERARTAGAGLQVWGWRVGFSISGGLALVLAPYLGWGPTYGLLALTLLLTAAGTLLGPEPPARGAPPTSLGQAIAVPLRALLVDVGPGRLALVLAFALLYRIADGMAGTQQVVFLRACGYPNELIGVTRTSLALVGAALGVLAAGWITRRRGEVTCLWVCGVAAALSNLFYPLLLLASPGAEGPGASLLLVVVLLQDNVCAGAVGAAMVGFLLGLCRSSCAATQYALLTAVMALGKYLLAPSGFLVGSLGWVWFFVISALAGVPGLLVLLALQRTPKTSADQ